MNDHDAERIAAAMNALRPDWPVKSLRTLLSRPELATRARRDVTVALAWVACESGTATPARVIQDGPWWRAANIEGTLVRRHPSADSACRRCGQEMTDRCCDAPSRKVPQEDHSELIAAARAGLSPAVSSVPGVMGE